MAFQEEEKILEVLKEKACAIGGVVVDYNVESLEVTLDNYEVTSRIYGGGGKCFQ